MIPHGTVIITPPAAPRPRAASRDSRLSLPPGGPGHTQWVGPGQGCTGKARRGPVTVNSVNTRSTIGYSLRVLF
eukprot:667128-Hanusia_phi.AAC.1